MEEINIFEHLTEFETELLKRFFAAQEKLLTLEELLMEALDKKSNSLAIKYRASIIVTHNHINALDFMAKAGEYPYLSLEAGMSSFKNHLN